MTAVAALLERLVIAVPTYNRLDTFLSSTLHQLKGSPSLLPKVHIYLQSAGDRKAYREAQGDGRIPSQIRLVNVRVTQPWGYPEIIAYIRRSVPMGTPLLFLHDDVKTLWYHAALQNYWEVTLTTFVRAALRASRGVRGTMVGMSPSKVWMPRSDARDGLFMIYDPLHLEITSRDLPLCHFRLKCDYEASLLAFLRGYALVRLGHFVSSTSHRPYTLKSSGGNEERKQREEVSESRAMAKVFHPLIRKVLERKGKYTSLEFKRFAERTPSQERTTILRRYEAAAQRKGPRGRKPNSH
jgi:hypothetical protein